MNDWRAVTRLWRTVNRHVQLHKEVTHEDLRRLITRAHVVVVDAARPLHQDARCQRCGRKMSLAYPVAGGLYGEKCATLIRRERGNQANPEGVSTAPGNRGSEDSLAG